MSEECSMGTEDCCHDACGDCCCGEHNYGEHDEWCEYYTRCPNDVLGCQCELDYCCHEASVSEEHNEDCYNYEEEEDDD